jgi:hypothetical protein
VSSGKSQTAGDLMWFKSTYSNGAGGECVEYAVTGSRVLVRDSKQSLQTQIQISPEAWSAFTAATDHLPQGASQGGCD